MVNGMDEEQVKSTSADVVDLLDYQTDVSKVWTILAKSFEDYFNILTSKGGRKDPYDERRVKDSESVDVQRLIVKNDADKHIQEMNKYSLFVHCDWQF